MYDKNYVILIAIAFIAIMTSPMWYHTIIAGEVIKEPDLELPEEGNCVEDADWMRAHHMSLLKEWRDEVVRHGDREYQSSEYGEVYNKTTDECFNSGCHAEAGYEEFCDECHTYNGLRTPNCFTDCHTHPTQEEEGFGS
ncbi:MAG: sulfate reduction electron transfer complex DsrMKJOP subunit DsrJ [Archaeoglobaceae archaeon]